MSLRGIMLGRRNPHHSTPRGVLGALELETWMRTVVSAGGPVLPFQH